MNERYNCQIIKVQTILQLYKVEFNLTGLKISSF